MGTKRRQGDDMEWNSNVTCNNHYGNNSLYVPYITRFLHLVFAVTRLYLGVVSPLDVARLIHDINFSIKI